MIEKRLSPNEIAQITSDLARQFTPSLHPGEPVTEGIQNNYLNMYRTLGTVGERRAENMRSNFYTQLWRVDGRPLFVASNRPIPQTPQATEFDTLSIVHGDIATNDPQTLNIYQEGESLYGQGVGDMKWAALAGIETITSAPESSPTGLIVYTNEEIGGADVEELAERNVFDETNVVFCADGAPIETGMMSIITAAKGGFRMNITTPPIPSLHTSRVHLLEELHPAERTSAFLLDAMGTIREVNRERGRENPDLTDWDTITFNPNHHGGEHPGKTPAQSGIVFDVRAVTTDDIAFAYDLLQQKAAEHGLDTDCFLRLKPYTAPLEHPLMQRFITVAQDTIGEENVLFNRDYGNSDVRHLPSTTFPILTGINGGNWHDARERVSIPAIAGSIDAHVAFIRSRATQPNIQYPYAV